MLIDTDDQLSVNDQILDENTKFIYEQLRQSTFYLTISSVIIIFLIFLLLISFYRFRKKEINQYFFREKLWVKLI